MESLSFLAVFTFAEFVVDASEIKFESCFWGVRIGNQCLSFSEEALSWSAAITACANNGSQLASLTDPTETQGYTIGKYGGQVQFWAGGSDTAQESRWVWLTGVPFEVQFPWGSDQPNNGWARGNEDCLMMNWKGGYNDASCNKKLRYVCEIAGCNGEPNTPQHSTANCSKQRETCKVMCQDGYIFPEKGPKSAIWFDCKGGEWVMRDKQSDICKRTGLESGEGNQVTVIIGCTVAVLLIVVIAAIVLTYLLGCHKKNENQQSDVQLENLSRSRHVSENSLYEAYTNETKPTTSRVNRHNSENSLYESYAKDVGSSSNRGSRHDSENSLYASAGY
ncbi:unnamed protein product, partial [Meganyctiphanes norvegica]